MRVGQLAATGTMLGMTAREDTVLFWTGGRAQVSVAYRDAEGAAGEIQFARGSGMIDLLPRGVILDRVQWQNEGVRSNWVSVSFPEAYVAELLGCEVVPRQPRSTMRFAVSDPHAADLITRLQAQVVAGSHMGAAYTRGLSLMLASYLFGGRHSASRFGRPDAGGEGRSREPGGLLRLEREALKVFIEDSLARDISVDDMAAVVGYSLEHFARLFKETFCLSPHQYVISRRVERAKTMLRDRGIPIAGVATACGFTSQSHLNVVFKRVTGVTPGGYRRG